MHKLKHYLFLSLLFCFFFAIDAVGQHTLEGVVRDAGNNEPLPGATVLIKGTTEHAITDAQGRYQMITSQSFPLTLTITYIGFTQQEIVIRKAGRLNIALKQEGQELGDVEIRGSRITEKQKQSPLTIEALDMAGIRETPAVNFYEGLGQLKGVDLTSASLGFKVINTRGFNSTSPVRSLQIIDGVDNQSPGLNFSLGNFLGASELDVQKVELIVGASSAYYGPNAFNGVISMTTRSPFVRPGFEMSIKAAERSLFESAVRWAQVIKNKKGEEKFAYKLNLSYMQAQDWEADNRSATPQSRSLPENPGGYDAVNTYGDEYIVGTDYSNSAASYPGLGVFYRKGYKEKDLVDYNTRNAKVGLALHYRIKPDVELIAASNFSAGTTVYQGDNRYSLKDVLFFQHKLEVKKENKWFLRAYNTHEDAGKSYDAYFTALLLQRAAKSDGDWKQDYENYWNQHYGLSHFRNFPGFPQPPGPGPDFVTWQASINPFLYDNYYDTLISYHQVAQAYASGPGFNPVKNRAFFEPGTYEFDTAFAGITSRKSFGENGSRFFDRSALYHVHGEYKFTPAFADIIAGGNFRLYTPNSAGTIFSDTSGRRIRNSEFGMYAGIEKKFVREQLKLNLTLRLDKNENFPYLLSPAASVVYRVGEDNYLRLSLSSAIRNPTLADQYLYYNVGRAILLGNIDGYKGLVTVPSLIRFYDLNKNFDSLFFFDVDPVRPEKVRTLELGFKGTVFRQLYVDVSGYYSRYQDFIGYKIGVATDTFTVSTPFAQYRDLTINNVYRVATNSKDAVTTMGAAIGLSYYIGRYLAVLGNYSWNVLDRQGSADPLIPAFNTPEHKFNLGFNGRDIHKFGFSINYKWVDGFVFEGSPQFTGRIDSYGLLDVQVNRQFPRDNAVLKIGASNILENKHYEVYGGPLIGRMIYVSFSFAMNSN